MCAMSYRSCMPMCEAVGTDGTGRSVKLGQAAQAEEEMFESGQHLQLAVILLPTIIVKLAGWGGGEATGSQRNACSGAVSPAFSVLPQCRRLPGPAAPHSGCSRAWPPQPPCWLYCTLWASSRDEAGSCCTPTPQQGLAAARAQQ